MAWSPEQDSDQEQIRNGSGIAGATTNQERSQSTRVGDHACMRSGRRTWEPHVWISCKHGLHSSIHSAKVHPGQGILHHLSEPALGFAPQAPPCSGWRQGRLLHPL